jgi:hypothetical protein
MFVFVMETYAAIFGNDPGPVREKQQRIEFLLSGRIYPFQFELRPGRIE